MIKHGTSSKYTNHGCRCKRCTKAFTRDHLNRVRSHNGLPPDDTRHGTQVAYNYWRCRCDLCKEWNRKSAAVSRGAAERRGLPDGDPRHGTRTGYDYWGCRCHDCKNASRRGKGRPPV